MAALFTAGTIVEEALREIGAYTIADAGPDPEEVRIGLRRLDMLLAELSGKDRFWWLVPESQIVSLSANGSPYSLNSLTEINLQNIIKVFRRDSAGKDQPVEMILREAYEEIEDKATTGPTLEKVYIERDEDPRLFAYPVPSAAVTLRLYGYGYAPEVYNTNGVINHTFPQAWQRYLTLILAADLASGPVRTLPIAERREKERRAEDTFVDLNTFNARENRARPRFTANRDF